MAESTEDVAVERVEEFGVGPDALWEAITDPALLDEWFGALDFDLVPGGAITDPDRETTIGVVETVEPEHRIGFVWMAPGSDAASAVELIVEDDGRGGSILHVREVRIEPRWDARPAWFTPSASASVGARG